LHLSFDAAFCFHLMKGGQGGPVGPPDLGRNQIPPINLNAQGRSMPSVPEKHLGSLFKRQASDYLGRRVGHFIPPAFQMTTPAQNKNPAHPNCATIAPPIIARPSSQKKNS
jgi:hypothetical protein